MIIKTWEMKKCIYCDNEFSAENPLDYCRKCYQMDKYELADMLLKQIDELKQQRGYWESKISELFNQASCAECGNRHKCEIMPKPGEFARINCWFYVKDGDQPKPDVADTDVGSIAEPKHEDWEYFTRHFGLCKRQNLYTPPEHKSCERFEPRGEPDTEKTDLLQGGDPE